MMLVSGGQFVLDEASQSAGVGDHSLISPEPGTLTAHLSRVAGTES